MLHEALTMNSTIVTMSKGMQITIPASLREELGLDVGSRMELEGKRGSIVLKPLGEELETLFKEAKTIKPKHKFTAEEMDKLIEHEILR